jgi:hypothetical protein
MELIAGLNHLKIISFTIFSQFAPTYDLSRFVLGLVLVLDFVILIVLSTPGVVHMRKTLDKKIGRKNLMNKKNNKKNSIPNLHV